MSGANPKPRRSLAAHRTTIDIAQRLLRAAGPKHCGGVRPSEFETVLAQLDDLRRLVDWIARHETDIRDWNAGRNRTTENGEQL